MAFGRLPSTADCSPLACGPKAGLVWNSSSRAGSVFTLDENGKPKGLSAFSIVAVPKADNTPGSDLVQSNSGSTVTGNLLVTSGLDPACSP